VSLANPSFYFFKKMGQNIFDVGKQYGFLKNQNSIKLTELSIKFSENRSTFVKK
jgi:hypothetical protein